MWSLTSAWGGFRGIVAKDWRERTRSTEEMYGKVYASVSQVPGLRVFPRLDPPLPTPGQYDVELVLQSEALPEQMLETTTAVLDAGWRSGKFLYVDTDLKIDLPEARVVLDRERIADLGLDLAGVGRELGTLLGGDYVNRFNFFERSYKVIPQIGEEDRATLGPLLDLKIKTPDGQLVPVSTFTHIETSTAPRTLNRFQQRNAVRIFGGVKPGVTKDEGLRVLETAAAGAQGVVLNHAGESRQIRRESSALTATLGFAAGVHLPGPHHHQHLLAGGVDHAGGTDRQKRHPDRGVREQAAVPWSREDGRGARGLADSAATGADDLGGHRLRALPAGARIRARRRGPNSIGTVLVAGMTVGTLFTLFVVPVFYSLIAAQRRPSPRAAAPSLAMASAEVIP